MLVKEKKRRISPSPHMANYIKQIIFAFLLICNTFVGLYFEVKKLHIFTSKNYFEFKLSICLKLRKFYFFSFSKFTSDLLQTGKHGSYPKTKHPNEIIIKNSAALF